MFKKKKNFFFFFFLAMVQFKHITKNLLSQPFLFVCLAMLCSMWES